MSNDKYFRFVLCVDVEADSLEEAYNKLYEAMKLQPFGWETTDEAYSSDGEQVAPDVVHKLVPPDEEEAA